MKKICMFIMAVAIIMTAALAETAVAGGPADSLVALAYENNPLVKAAHEKTLLSELAVKEAAAKLGPKIGAVGGALWNNCDIAFALPSMFGLPPLEILPKNTYGVALGFMQTVYAGGALRAGVRAAQLAADAMHAEETRVKQTIRNDVKQAYYNVKRAEQKLAVAREALSLTKEHGRRAQKLFDYGMVAKNDVLRSKVAISQAELDLIKVENALALSKTVLERTVGIEITDIPADPTSASISAVTSVDVYESAYANRAELAVYSLLSKQADNVARAARGQLLPQIMAVGALAKVDDSFSSDGGSEFRVGIAAYWTLFDNGEISARTKQAKARARELIHMLNDSRNMVKAEVQRALLNEQSARVRFETAERQVTESREDYRVATRRYEEQVGTNLEVQDARLAMIKSLTERVDAEYDVKIAESELEFAVGQ